MLYPTNIQIEKESKRKIVKEKTKELLKEVKRRFKYLIFDRKNIKQKMAMKFHI